MMPPKKLIPIIAGYLGCKISYEYYIPPIKKIHEWKENIATFNTSHLDGFAERPHLYQNLKLHLRPLSAITDAELNELFKIGNPAIPKDDLFVIRNYYTHYKRAGNLQISINEFNYLRSISILVDDSILEFVK